MEPHPYVSPPGKRYEIETTYPVPTSVSVQPSVVGGKTPGPMQNTSLPRGTRNAAAQPVPPQRSVRTPVTPAEPVWRGRAGLARLSPKCLLLAVAYGFGAVLAGVLQARSNGHVQTFLGLYLQNYADLLALRSAKGAVTLFGTQYFSSLAAATLLLVSGLCAFGPLLIFLFVIFYGVGTGMVSLQLLLQASWQQAALVLLFWGLPVSLAAACLCAFGSSALSVGRQKRHTDRSFYPASGGAIFVLGRSPAAPLRRSDRTVVSAGRTGIRRLYSQRRKNAASKTETAFDALWNRKITCGRNAC
jgi:hypothetical protein